ncbi:deoxyhypusine synthase isoform X3 [Rissa tridactyla]|uniref:deoxyhypusine synthase isoform X3 n=1 Tax=Rissa tridactyla TaxID=75485 RepID=UPI0023BA6B27|nr:deoxyhypusine synthase isoform X3 [Rissa tridactyla]
MAAPAPVPAGALRAVLKPSGPLPTESLPVRGYDFSGGPDHAALLRSFRTTGFQATSFAQAVAEIQRMIAAKLEPLSEEERARAALGGRRPPSGCTIFLGFTSNLVSSGVRETIRYLLQHNMVDVVVTTAGGVEEDLIKCLAPTYIGDFSLRGQDLRRSGINRIGNLLVPNDNYCKFEDWLMPILEQMVDEQETQNNIPVLSPALTDGSLGDMIFFHSYKRPGLVLDIVEGHLRQEDGDDHPGRGAGEAPHRQRQPHEERGRLLRLRQHGAGVRRLRLGSAAGRGRVLGQDPDGCHPRQGLRRRLPGFSAAGGGDVRPKSRRLSLGDTGRLRRWLGVPGVGGGVSPHLGGGPEPPL